MRKITLLLAILNFNLISAQTPITCDGFSEIIDSKYFLTYIGNNHQAKKYGIIDIEGNQIIENKLISNTGSSYFKIKLSISQNVIFGIDSNTKKKIIYNIETQNSIDYEYDNYVGFNENIAILWKVKNNENLIFAIDRQGNKLFDLPKNTSNDLRDFGKFNEGLARIQINKKYNPNASVFQKLKKTVYIDTLGEIKIDKQFKYYGDFYNNRARVCKEIDGVEKWGFINKKGEVIIDFIFSEIPTEFNNNLSRVKTKDKLYGYIDINGIVVIKPKYIFASGFYNDNALVKKDKTWLIINSKDEILHEFKKFATIAIGFLDHSSKQIEIIKTIVENQIFNVSFDLLGWGTKTINMDEKETFNKDWKVGRFKEGYSVIGYFNEKKKFVSAIINKKGDLIFVVKENQF